MVDIENIYIGKEVMSDYVATGDWCYYCRTYYSAEHIAYQLFTDNKLEAVCKECEKTYGWN